MARGNDIAAIQEIPGKIVSGTMQAAVLSGPGQFHIENVKIPSPGPNQIRVMVEGCGICVSNIRAWQGVDQNNYPLNPGAPGHEGWGIVDEVGEKVTGYAPGEKVAFLSNNAFAEFDIVETGNLIKLPPTLRSYPFTAEPLGQVVTIFNKCEVKKGQTIAIVGMGFQGLLLAQMIKRTGAKVIALSRRAYALAFAKELGVDEVILLDDDHQIIEQAQMITKGKLCSTVIEMTGKEWPLNIAAQLVASKGRLVIGGIHLDGVRNINMYMWNLKGFDVINAYQADSEVLLDGIRQGLKMVLEKEINLFSLYTHKFSLEQMAEGLEMAHERPEGFVKGLLVF